jgi:cytochrome c-type biogenesis protein CcmE
MSPKRQRMLFAFFGVGFLVTATLLILNAFDEHLVFFFTPTDLQQKELAPNQRIRIGGLVEDGSIEQNETGVTFIVTDLTHSVPASYDGVPPALFREGQGVVAEGYMADGQFTADKLLAKHDENYMPPEVADALKASGKWKHNAEQTVEP